MLTCLHAHGVSRFHSTLFVRNARNPLLKDPTRTTMIRARFQTAVRGRFGRLKKAVIEFVDTKDAFGLKDRHSFITANVTTNVQEREYQFLTDSAKISAFSDWFKQRADANVLSVATGSADPQKPWTAEFVESAYKRGQLNAYLSSKEALAMQAQGIGDQTQEQFLRSSFMAPEAVSKVQLLATRAFEGMKGITATMSSDMSRILSQGMLDGSGARDIAREMAARIDDLTSKRALVIARTETIHAHAEGQLDAFQKLGVEELGVKAEWSTAGDDRVCEQCASNEGTVFDMKDARGMIPLHPNCRCSWIPAPEKSIAEVVRGAGVSVPVESPSSSTWSKWNDSEEMMQSISQAEKDALVDYTGDSSYINMPLRHGQMDLPGRADMRDTMDNLMSRAPALPKETTLYRAMDADAFGSLVKDGVLTDAGYTSTSVSKEAHAAILSEMKGSNVKPVSLKIVVPAGTKGLKLSAVNEAFAEQDEFLLPRGARFVVEKKTADSATLRYIAPGEALPVVQSSEESAAKWVSEYSWNTKIDSMPDASVSAYLEQFVPKKPVTLYRFELADHDPSKALMQVPVQSWTHNKKMATTIAEMQSEGGVKYVVKSKTFSPEEIFTDFTKFPKSMRAELEKLGGDSDMQEVLVKKAVLAVKEPKAAVKTKSAMTPFPEVSSFSSFADKMHKGETFSIAEQEAAGNWQGSKFIRINNHLRLGKSSAFYDPTEDIAQLDAIMVRSSVPEPMTVFRGGVPGEMLPGSIIQDASFAATSTNWESTIPFVSPGENLLAIRVPKGGKGMVVSKVTGTNSQNENEFLLNRSSKFKVTDEFIEKSYTDKAGVTSIQKFRVVDLIQ